MKYKVGDKVRFNQDCRLAFGIYIPKGKTGKITGVVDTGLTIAYRIKMKDCLNATVPTDKVDEACTKIKSKNDKSDVINGLTNTDTIKPDYYQFHGYDVFDIAEHFGLDFPLGNALKYLLRCKHKENEEQDLRKAIKCIERHLEMMEGKDNV